MKKIQHRPKKFFFTLVVLALALVSSVMVAHAFGLVIEDPSKPAEKLSDEDLSALAQQAIGIDPYHTSRRCTSCHRISAETVKSWGGRFADISNHCFQNKKIEQFAELSQADAAHAIQCMHTNPADARSPYHPSRLGLWAGAADHMGPLFEKSGVANWQNEYRQFLNRVRMPMNRSSSGFTPYQVDILREWIKRNYVYLNNMDLGFEPPPEVQCTPYTSNELKQMITDHQMQNWGTVNKSRGMISFACSPRKPASACFQVKDENGHERFPLIQNVERYKTINNKPTSWNIRYLTRMPYSTIFWTRSSADGQFSAAGMTALFNGNDKVPVDTYTAGAAIADFLPLLKGEPPRVIPVHASFDPAFFSDNSGFSIQGVNSKDAKRGGTLFCPRSVLLDKHVTEITDQTENCTQSELSLYHSTAVSLNGDDYIAMAGDFGGDAGDSDDEYSDGYAPAESILTFLPMLFNGKVYTAGAPTSSIFEYQRDFLISPSANLMSARAFGFDRNADVTVQDGYNIHKIVRKTNTDGELVIETENVGRVCARGGKAPISTNQRFLTFYRFVRTSDYKEFGFQSPDDEEFQNLVLSSTSNVYVHDILTQKTYRVTNMKAGDRAVFPHFRTDDWLMFVVKEPYKDDYSAREHMMVSDIAIKLSAQ